MPTRTYECSSSVSYTFGIAITPSPFKLWGAFLQRFPHLAVPARPVRPAHPLIMGRTEPVNQLVESAHSALQPRTDVPAKVRLEINYQITAADDRARFQKAAQWVAEQFDIQDFQVSIAIVDDPTIHQLNLEHLEHDWPTDVISFIFETDCRARPRRG